jgi:DedD protein
MLKSRSGHPVNAPASAPLSIEMVRRRARHRLIGASVLVLVGVVGFSLLFDTQPRPISVDIPIEIPTRAAVPPLPAASAVKAAPAPAPAPAAAASTPLPVPVQAQDVLDEREAVVSEPASPAPPAAATAAKSPPGGAPRPDDGSRAQALLEGRASPAQATTQAPADAASTVRLVVQVGAFADNARAQEVRMRLERAGLKTYTHVANTPEGRRIRVRIGPFDSRQDAEKAAERVKALKLPARVLTL